MIHKNLLIISLIVYTLIIFLPPLLYGYVYPVSGGDYIYHLQRIQTIAAGGHPEVVYWGDYIVGYPLIWLSKLGLSIGKSFLWFHFLMLWLVGVSWYLLLASLFGRTIGLTSFLIMFASPSIWNLYDTGALYDLMTVGIILPLLLVCIVKLIQKRYQYTLYVIILLLLGVTLHSIGIFTVQPGIANNIIPSESIATLGSNKWQLAAPTHSILSIIGIPILILLSALLGWYIKVCKKIKLSKEVVATLFVLSGIIMVFLPLSFVNITGFSMRFAIDLAIIVSILTMCLTGLFLSRVKDNATVLLVSCAIFTGGIPVLLTYFKL